MFPAMKTLGIDLASAPDRTGVALVDWRDGAAHLEHLAVGADDDALCALHAGADATGLDSPFGWPRAFVDFVASHGDPSTVDPGGWSPDRVRTLRFRETDRAARAITGRWPLSPSSDLIAVPTFRCLGLLARMGVTDRSGVGGVYETYPALALACWGLTDKGYKGRARRDRLSTLVDTLLARTPWLALDPAAEALIRRVDDAFDALVAALIARAARLGLATPPSDAQRAAAVSEGWIVIPHPDALDHLASPDANDATHGI